jgi:hypothetical protein
MAAGEAGTLLRVQSTDASGETKRRARSTLKSRCVEFAIVVGSGFVIATVLL